MAEEFTSTIQFDTSTAIRNIQLLTSQVNSYSASLTNNSAAARKFNADQSRWPKTLQGGAKAADKAKKSIKDLANQSKKAAVQANRLELSWRSVLRVFAIQVVGRAVSALTSELAQSVGRAKELQIALAEIQTISPELQALDLSGVQELTAAISTDLGIDQLEVAAGLYQSLSNQVGNAAETLQFLREAAEFSIATNTELSASVDLLSGALNSLGLNTSQTRRIMDVLFKTIEFGRVKGEELANAFGKILPIANELGISIEELAAQVSTVTIKGVAFDKTSVLLIRVMTGLLKPTKELQAAFDRLGISSVQAGIQVSGGLVPFLTLLKKETDGTIEGTSEFFNELRELQGVLLLTSDNGEQVADTLKRIKEEAGGAARAAADLVLESPAKQLEKSLEEFKNIVVSDFGNPAIDIINGIIKSLGGVDKAAQVFFTTVTVGAAIIGPILAFQLAGAIGGMTAALINASAAAFGFNIAITSGPAFIFIAALAVATTAIILLNSALDDTPDRVQEIADRFDALKAASEGIRAIVLENQQKINESLKETASENIRTIIGQVIELQKLYLKDRDSAIAAQQQVTDNLRDQVNKRVKAVDKAIQKVVDAEKDAIKTIERLGRESLKFEFDINQRKFDLNLQATRDDPRKQVRLLRKRIKESLRAAQRADDPKQQQIFLQEAVRRTQQLANLDGERARAGRTFNKIVKVRRDLVKQEIENAAERVKLAQELTPILKAQQAAIKRTQIELDNLVKKRDKGIGKLSEKDLNTLQREIGVLQDRLKSQREEFTVTGAPIISEKDIKDILEPIRSAITGQPITLKIASEEAVARTIKILKRIPDSIPIEVRLDLEQLTGEAFDIRGGGPLQAGLSKVTKELKTGIDNSSKFVDAQIKVADSLNKVQIAGIGVIDSARGIAKEAAKTAGPLLGIVTSVQPKLLEFIQQFVDLRNQLEAATRAGDTDAIQSVIDKIGELQKIADRGVVIKGISNLDQAQLSTNLATLASIAVEAIKVNVALQAAIKQKADVAGLFFNIKGLSDLVKDKGLGQAAKQNFDIIGNSAIQQVPKVDALTEAVLRLKAAQASSGPTQGLSRGGPVKFFNEGGQARGTDTVPAMLTPGEFVVNATSSRRFFSELVAINSGQAPIFRQEGGPVTNNSFTGDININMPAGTPIDGRAVAKQIRRELRRNTSRLEN